MIQEDAKTLKLQGSSGGELSIANTLDRDDEVEIEIYLSDDSYSWAWLGAAERRALIEHLERLTPPC